ncbi:uncharacterized protein LOC126834161 [Adelges cooleyi]|uniref:uncharacterized protein LOC126834161 n=1 Tax=Adelges cooleyi TaxID=133065 RepID=UPI00218047C7|nr:uncharacterized protein LOC126834161 [Adelges cooleyi]XP_050421856.1 uncharacterized protein LOC126834161 [Adelges cooleyi]XP_050421857.1 uncharacterized protein LOC126834161 [Adelges cooleyi]
MAEIKRMNSIPMQIPASVPSTPTVSNQILLINNAEGQLVSGILIPQNHFMLKINKNQLSPESEPESDVVERESPSKYFSMNSNEKKMFRETFYNTLYEFMHQIVKGGRVVSSSDPIWDQVALKLDNILKPKSIYNRFILNKHGCRSRLIEAYLKEPGCSNANISLLNDTMSSDKTSEIIEKRPGHVDNETFYNALYAFKDKVIKNGEVAPSVDSVWCKISAHLNNALKPNSIYLRFKRNTHDCQKKLLAHCKLDPSTAKTYEVSTRKVIQTDKSFARIKKKNLKFEDSTKFFKALYAHRHLIIQHGAIAKQNSFVWNEVAKMLDYALEPADVHSKFIRNHDLCQTKLIEACKEDQDFTPLHFPKFNKQNCVSDDTFFNVLCKYRNDILQNGKEIAKFSHPVWTQISRDLNDTLKPATVYFRVSRNSQMCLNRLIKLNGSSDFSCKEVVDKDKFFETICLYKYSIMHGDKIADASDSVWNEISLQLNSAMSPEAIFNTVSKDEHFCKTKMIHALKTECSVFSGENIDDDPSETISEVAPIVECNVDESIDDFVEVLKEFKDSILKSNGRLAMMYDNVWREISSRIKYLKPDEVYKRVINDYKNCRTLLFSSAFETDKSLQIKLCEAIFEYRKSIINDRVIANINNPVWTKISDRINRVLDPKEIYIKFIKDKHSCRTKLMQGLKEEDPSESSRRTSPQVAVNKDRFLDVLLSHKELLMLNGTHVNAGDPIWHLLAEKLDYQISPTTVYNYFSSNKYNCLTKVKLSIEEERKALNVNDDKQKSTKFTTQIDHDYTKGDVETYFEDLASMRQKVGYVQESDFFNACMAFKDEIIKNGSIVSCTNDVWEKISKYLNYAIKAKTAYLRFKRNTHNCQAKMFDCMNISKPRDTCTEEDLKIENEMFFDAISIFKHSIINNGKFVGETSPVWLDVSNLMNNLLTPEEAFWKFRRNVDSCRNKLAEKCAPDWAADTPSTRRNRLLVMESTETHWNDTLQSDEVEREEHKECVKEAIRRDTVFYDAVYKHKDEVFKNELIANSASPVWTAVANELKYEWNPMDAYLKFKNNMANCNTKFAEAALRHNLKKSKQDAMDVDVNSRDQPMDVDREVTTISLNVKKKYQENYENNITVIEIDSPTSESETENGL